MKFVTVTVTIIIERLELFTSFWVRVSVSVSAAIVVICISFVR